LCVSISTILPALSIESEFVLTPPSTVGGCIAALPRVGSEAGTLTTAVRRSRCAFSALCFKAGVILLTFRPTGGLDRLLRNPDRENVNALLLLKPGCYFRSAKLKRRFNLKDNNGPAARSGARRAIVERAVQW
jgi:hypothetical protein